MCVCVARCRSSLTLKVVSDVGRGRRAGRHVGAPVAQSLGRLEHARVVAERGRANFARRRRRRRGAGAAASRRRRRSPQKRRRVDGGGGHISGRSRPRHASQLGCSRDGTLLLLVVVMVARGRDGGDADVVFLGQRGRGRDGVGVTPVAAHRRHAHHFATAAPEVGVERDVDEGLGGGRGEEEPLGGGVRTTAAVVPRRRPAVDQLDHEERRHQHHAHHVQYHQHLHHLHLTITQRR